MKNYSQNDLKSERSVTILSQLVRMLDCSLARYLSYAPPWAPRPSMLLERWARDLSLEHASFAERLVILIDARRGVIPSCVFPSEFTYYNDLSLEYLAPRLLDHQRILIKAAEECADRLPLDPEAQTVVKQLVTSLRQNAAIPVESLAPEPLVQPLAGKKRDRMLQQKTASSTSKERLRQKSVKPNSAA